MYSYHICGLLLLGVWGTISSAEDYSRGIGVRSGTGGGAGYEYNRVNSYSEQGYGDDKKDTKQKGGRYYYGGKYSGKCGPDGLYYRDDYSFVLCSNAKGYVQPCAPGTKNTGYTDYAPGYYYGYSDFCNINLVDLGYSAPKYGPGYQDKPSYGFAAYRYPVGGYGPKSPSGYQQNTQNRYDSQPSSYGQRDSYGSQAGYDTQSNNQYGNTGYKTDGGYQTRNNYEYKNLDH